MDFPNCRISEAPKRNGQSTLEGDPRIGQPLVRSSPRPTEYARFARLTRKGEKHTRAEGKGLTPKGELCAGAEQLKKVLGGVCQESP